MKKTLRMMGLVALAVLALAGCKKDEQTTSSFKATLPQPTSDAKTHIGNGDSLLWNAGDAIKVFDTDGNAYLFTTDDDNKSTATFTGETSLNASNTYTAFYPAANTSDVTNGEILLTLAADQTYVAGGFANGTYPVVAQNEGASFTFDSDCGLLAIPVMGTGNISTIELTGKASENLAGQLRYDLSGHYLGLTNAQTTVTLDCGNLPLSADATTFYFVVPAGVFANGFTAVLKNGATELFTLATTNPNTIVAKRIRQMNPVTVSAITLVTGGGTPANVGYTDATVYGSYVAPTGMGVTEIGFYFGTDASAMTATPVTPIASPFSHTFDGLTAGTTYYYQAYVKNGTNEYLGTVESFTTNVPAATVTTAPTAKTGVTAGQNEAIVNAGVAEGGTMMYMVTTENTKPTSTTGFSATVPTAETLASGTYYVWYYVQGDATHTDSEISATGIEVTIAPAVNAVDLSTLTADYEAQNGDVLTNETTSYKVTIADGATVTLDGATISGSSYCIKCLGSATIILKDGTTNTLTSTSDQYPALSAGDAGTTLTIQGSTGALNVQSGFYCAGIGGGYMNTNHTCGNIRIEGGVITATGGSKGAGIGSDCGSALCGNIDITGGTVTATGGNFAAGIGTGNGDGHLASCGSITITNGVTKVTATMGVQAPNSIGKGYSLTSCGTVTIGGTIYWDGSAYQNGGDTYLTQSPLVYEP